MLCVCVCVCVVYVSVCLIMCVCVSLCLCVWTSSWVGLEANVTLWDSFAQEFSNRCEGSVIPQAVCVFHSAGCVCVCVSLSRVCVCV